MTLWKMIVMMVMVFDIVAFVAGGLIGNEGAHSHDVATRGDDRSSIYNPYNTGRISPFSQQLTYHIHTRRSSPPPPP
jgi:hypothetical protein